MWTHDPYDTDYDAYDPDDPKQPGYPEHIKDTADRIRSAWKTNPRTENA